MVTRYVPTDPRDMRVLDVAPTQFSAEPRLDGVSVQDEQEGTLLGAGRAWLVGAPEGHGRRASVGLGLGNDRQMAAPGWPMVGGAVHGVAVRPPVIRRSAGSRGSSGAAWPAACITKTGTRA